MYFFFFADNEGLTTHPPTVIWPKHQWSWVCCRAQSFSEIKDVVLVTSKRFVLLSVYMISLISFVLISILVHPSSSREASKVLGRRYCNIDVWTHNMFTYIDNSVLLYQTEHLSLTKRLSYPDVLYVVWNKEVNSFLFLDTWNLKRYKKYYGLKSDTIDKAWLLFIMEDSSTCLHISVILNIPEHHHIVSILHRKVILHCLYWSASSCRRENRSFFGSGNWQSDFHPSSLVSKGKNVIEKPTFLSQILYLQCGRIIIIIWTIKMGREIETTGISTQIKCENWQMT